MMKTSFLGFGVIIAGGVLMGFLHPEVKPRSLPLQVLHLVSEKGNVDIDRDHSDCRDDDCDYPHTYHARRATHCPLAEMSQQAGGKLPLPILALNQPSH